MARNSPELKVYGIEICEQAVSDARHNATRNNITNATFVCGPAEDVIHKTVKNINTKNIIAVVDPPRAGKLLFGFVGFCGEFWGYVGILVWFCGDFMWSALSEICRGPDPWAQYTI